MHFSKDTKTQGTPIHMWCIPVSEQLEQAQYMAADRTCMLAKDSKKQGTPVHILTMIVYPQIFLRGFKKGLPKTVTGNFLTSFQKHLLVLRAQSTEKANALSAFGQLLWLTDGISTTTVMTTKWHFDRTVTQRKNLEQNGIENICLLHQSRSLFLSRQSKKES